MTETKLAPGSNGGKLNRGGRKPGAKSLITKTFQEFARAVLDDPKIQAKLYRRVSRELDQRGSTMPGLTVLAAAAVREIPAANRKTAMTFSVQIVNGRGVVERIDDKSEAQDVEALPAAPENVTIQGEEID